MFNVIYQKQGSQAGIITSSVPDPGYRKEVSCFIGNLKEASTYEFTVRAKNSYKGLSTSYSKTEMFDTKGIVYLFELRILNGFLRGSRTQVNLSELSYKQKK